MQKEYLRLPDYGRTDLSLQYRATPVHNRFFTRFDAFFNVYNLFDNLNVRDYFWTAGMHRIPIYLSPINCDMGVRLGFRL